MVTEEYFNYLKGKDRCVTKKNIYSCQNYMLREIPNTKWGKKQPQNIQSINSKVYKRTHKHHQVQIQTHNDKRN